MANPAIWIARAVGVGIKKGVKKLIKKKAKKRSNPGLSNLRTQSFILKTNRQQGYPLGDLPSAATKIAKKTGRLTPSTKKQTGIKLAKFDNKFGNKNKKVKGLQGMIDQSLEIF